MSNSAHTASNGISLAGLLTIVFITLKLLGVIGWPWVWVLGPLWVPFAVVVVFFATVAFVALAFLAFIAALAVLLE